jgi:hypothetical protein
LEDIKNKSDLINYIIKQHDYRTYLEIGVRHGYNFDSIRISLKESVDPDLKFFATYKMTSDEFFNRPCHINHYDVVFIDGMHLWEYAFADITNSLKYLSPYYIIVHDCNPIAEKNQLRSNCKFWNGDVWKAWVYLRQFQQEDLDLFVVDIDQGCGIITDGHHERFRLPGKNINWKSFEKNREEWLNLKDVEYFKTFVRNKSGTA